MEIDQTKAFADALELDMRFHSNLDLMLHHPAYAKLKDDPEAVKLAFSRLCGGSRLTWAWFIRYHCPKAWAAYDAAATQDTNGFYKFNVNWCIQYLRKWGKEHGYDVGDGDCDSRS